MMGLVLAQVTPKERLLENKLEREDIKKNLKDDLKEGGELALPEKKLVLKRLKNKRFELRSEDAIAKTNLDLNNLEGKSLRVKLSDGKYSNIKIMPDVAKARIIKKLRLRSCDESNNCSIELREIKKKGKPIAVYEAKVEKKFRLFGLFKIKREVLTQVNSETGEELKIRGPWWRFLAYEEVENQEGNSVIREGKLKKNELRDRKVK
tara:strand:+ start:5171 stop:5791 length:621 start_codon:yes stop_codon:yes gene_type:complete